MLPAGLNCTEGGADKVFKNCYSCSMNANELLAYLDPIVSSCPLWEGEKLKVVIIANPNAGGFTQKRRSNVHEAALAEACAVSQKRERLCAGFAGAVFYTEFAGHAAQLTRDVADEAVRNPQTAYLIVSAGGDGTGLEIQTELTRLSLDKSGTFSAEYPKAVRERLTVLRLPFGTGNDSSDGRTMGETLDRLILPAHFALQRAVRVYFTGVSTPDERKTRTKRIIHYDSLSSLPPWYAFNIASIGIDAFIAHMTNHTKGVLPGNFYKLWIDLACLFYETKFPAATAKITAFDAADQVVQVINEPFLFCLMGVSGHRTYGCNQKILPNNRNVCLARQMSIIQKLLVKEQFKAGKHSGNKTAVLLSAEKLIIEYDRDILAQLDGEIHYVQASQFPLVFERTEPLVRVIELDNAPFYKGADV